MNPDKLRNLIEDGRDHLRALQVQPDTPERRAIQWLVEMEIERLKDRLMQTVTWGGSHHPWGI